jgi:hypothetical protein
MAAAFLLLIALAQCDALVAMPGVRGTARVAPLIRMARPREYAKSARVVERPKPSPELKKKQNAIGALVGVAYFAQFAIIQYGVLARLSLVKAPPLNTFTDIANAAMEQAIAIGELQPLVATAWAQVFWVELIKEYYSSGQPDDFVASWCAAAEHSAYCTAAGL